MSKTIAVSFYTQSTVSSKLHTATSVGYEELKLRTKSTHVILSNEYILYVNFNSGISRVSEHFAI